MLRIYNAILLLLPISFLKLLKNANRNTANIYFKRSIRKKKRTTYNRRNNARDNEGKLFF